MVDKGTVAENEPKQVYPVIKYIRTILINHRSYIDCRILKRYKQAPSCGSNC